MRNIEEKEIWTKKTSLQYLQFNPELFIRKMNN